MDNVETELKVLADCDDEADRLMAADVFEQAGREREAAWLRDSRLVLVLCGGHLLLAKQGPDRRYLLELADPDGDRVFIHDDRNWNSLTERFRYRVVEVVTRRTWYSPVCDFGRPIRMRQLVQPHRNNYWIVVAMRNEFKLVARLFRQLETFGMRQATRLWGLYHLPGPPPIAPWAGRRRPAPR